MKLKSTQVINEIRRSSEYKKWRKQILERDDYQCVLCGSKEKIEVDHIEPINLYPELAFDENNGRTLCKECHKKTNTYGKYSIFKDSSDIPPALKGNLYYKIQALPKSIYKETRKGKETPIGFNLFYNSNTKKWNAGYKFAKIKILGVGDDPSMAVDDLFEKLKYEDKVFREEAKKLHGET